MKTILLVDDEPALLTSFGLALRTNGYRVIEADSGASGLEMARCHLPDLILSDIHMPGGDGSTFLRNIRRDPELKSKQVVLMTGNLSLVNSRKGMEEGADDFLIKPVSLQALLSCVQARFNRASVSWRVEDQVLAQLRTSMPSQLPHEFFTPLAGIIGLTEILRADSENLSSSEISEIHNSVYQSAMRLHRTLKNYVMILDLPIESSEAAPPPLSSVEAEASICSGVSEALRRNERRDDVTVRANGSSILAKPAHLSRIVEELVDNACKFSRRQTPVNVELLANGRLVVTDRGRGLTAEEIGRIGAFQQFDRKKYEQQGLGLGLVLVQKLAALCKAEFSMTSQPGEGTQVQIAFA
jgi:two-component system, sensor histidine kinase and response regulator